MKTLIAFAGLPASGKSTVARHLCQALDCPLLDKDRVREFLFKQYVDYTDNQNDLCVSIIYQVAHYLLSTAQTPMIILDGRSYSRRKQIDALMDAANSMQARVCLVECVCSEASAQKRLTQDQGIHPAKDRDFTMYLRSKASAEPITEPRLILDTDQCTAEQGCEQVLTYLAGSQ